VSKKENNNSPKGKCNFLYDEIDKPFTEGALYLNKMYIYIITHPKFKGWIKLGRTENLKLRLTHYQTTCPFRAFKIEYFIETKHVKIIESYFTHNIKNNGYEWFHCSVKYGIKKITEQLKIMEAGYFDLKQKRKSNYIKTNVKADHHIYHNRYDYLVDGKIFNSIKDLAKYINITVSTFNGIMYTHSNYFRPGKVLNIKGYKIIRKKHIPNLN